MINSKEMSISNKSYVNKDFASVYAEALDLCSKITNRWTPESSNESDPGLVLLKLMSAIADKNNYNIDKNVLECFMPSATQETSMRNLCEMNGYNMKYYRSATTNIEFRYTENLDSSFVLPKYDTVLTSEDGNIKYTLIQDCTIDLRDTPRYALAIEGTMETLSVGDSIVVQLLNLDDNNRIYLPERLIAENGIFIIDNNNKSNTWERVEYLHTQELNKKVFKFGVDSQRNLPYIEFPSDISSLIGTGLIIKYIITNGSEGNISANTITKIISPDLTIDNNGDKLDRSEYLRINNNSYANDGSDPETIDQAYSNFKRVVGTFNTLVTARDYANYIYNLVDENTFKYIVSNIVVADRRNDFNYSNNVLSYSSSYGSYLIPNSDPEKISANDLCMYPLRPMDSNYNIENYMLSFTPMAEESGLQLLETDPNLESSKCMSFNYKEISDDDIYCFKNYYTLNVDLSTYDKLNSDQENDLIKNIRYALIKNFNAREVDFGEEIPYDKLKSVIQKADSRIRNIILTPPTLRTAVMRKSNTEEWLEGDTESQVKIAVKNILSGSISLFEYNSDFNLDYGQKGSGNSQQDNEYSVYAYTNLDKFSSQVIVPITELDGDINPSGYTLKDNEIIQFISPSLASYKKYGTYVNYRFESKNVEYIPSDTIYKLSGDDKLYITYTDVDSNIEYKILYTPDGVTVNGNFTDIPSIISTSFDLYVMDEDSLTKTSRQIIYGGEVLKYWILSSSESIEVKKYVSTELNNPLLKCYWIMNNSNNILFNQEEIVDGKITVLLDNGEYFIYSNSELTDLVILGSGTRLTINNVDSSFTSWTIPNTISIEDINEKGVAAFEDSGWQNKQLTSTPITVEEMDIYTLGKGDNITLDKGPTAVSVTDFTNKYQSLKGWAVIIKRSDEENPIRLEDLSLSSEPWMGRSRLDLSSSFDIPQMISRNQEISLFDGIGTRYTIHGTVGSDGKYTPVYIGFNQTLEFSGPPAPNNPGDPYYNKTISLKNKTVSGETEDYQKDIRALVYEKQEITYPKSSSKTYSGMALNRDRYGRLIAKLDGFGSAVGGSPLTLPVMKFKKDVLLLIYYLADKDKSPATVTVSCDNNCTINFFNSADTPSKTLTLKVGLNVIQIGKNSGNITKLDINHNGTNSTDLIYIGNLKLIEGYNKALDGIRIEKGSGSESSVLEMIQTLGKVKGEDMFNYLADIENDRALSIRKNRLLIDPEMFWDKNNIANRITIGEIDLVDSVFNLMPASRKDY